MLILFPFFFQKFWELDWLENLPPSFKEYHDTFLKKERRGKSGTYLSV